MKLKNVTLALCAIMLPLVLSGCLYSHVRHPLDLDLHETRLGTKVGESTARSILWLFAWGDAGTQAAAQQGNLTKLYHMDTEITFILFGLYASSTTIVYGD
ncbi:MAG: TRL domain-containing protein [Planctomycetota bacterium]